MLRELLGFCIPVLFHTPLLERQTVLPEGESGGGWILWMLKMKEEAFMRVSGLYGGKVVGLSEDTITVWQRGALVPRKFALAPAMLSDRIALIRGPGIGHRLKDVRLGDMVSLDVSPIHDGFVCYAMGIFRRPGGKIPPAEDDYLPERCRMHNIYNAHQFMEERFIPNLSRSVANSTRWLAR